MQPALISCINSIDLRQLLTNEHVDYLKTSAFDNNFKAGNERNSVIIGFVVHAYEMPGTFDSPTAVEAVG